MLSGTPRMDRVRYIADSRDPKNRRDPVRNKFPNDAS